MLNLPAQERATWFSFCSFWLLCVCFIAHQSGAGYYVNRWVQLIVASSHWYCHQRGRTRAVFWRPVLNSFELQVLIVEYVRSLTFSVSYIYTPSHIDIASINLAQYQTYRSMNMCWNEWCDRYRITVTVSCLRWSIPFAFCAQDRTKPDNMHTWVLAAVVSLMIRQLTNTCVWLIVCVVVSDETVCKNVHYV